MKKLLIAAALFAAFAAQAESIAWIPNNANGRIVLTDDKMDCRGDMRYMFSISGTGNVNAGCWSMVDIGNGDSTRAAAVVYSDGSHRVYNATWNFTPYGNAQGYNPDAKRRRQTSAQPSGSDI